MAFKTFYENINVKMQKEENLKKSIYTNPFVRKGLDNKTELSQLDLFGKIENFKISRKKEGLSVFLEKCLKNKEDIHLSINQKIENLKENRKQLIFLDKIKGGNRVFYSGFSGFSPSSQIKLFSSNLIKSVFSDKNAKRRITNYNFLLSNDRQQKKKLFHIFRAPFKKETMKVSAQFSRLKTKKKNKTKSTNKNQLNFVYIFGDSSKKVSAQTKLYKNFKRELD